MGGQDALDAVGYKLETPRHVSNRTLLAMLTAAVVDGSTAAVSQRFKLSRIRLYVLDCDNSPPTRFQVLLFRFKPAGHRHQSAAATTFLNQQHHQAAWTSSSNLPNEKTQSVDGGAGSGTHLPARQYIISTATSWALPSPTIPTASTSWWLLTKSAQMEQTCPSMETSSSAPCDLAPTGKHWTLR